MEITSYCNSIDHPKIGFMQNTFSFDFGVKYDPVLYRVHDIHPKNLVR